MSKTTSNIDGHSISYERQNKIFKIIVIGDTNVGKTCLTYRFCGGKFPLKTEATIGVDFRERQVVVDNETIKLQLWDTAGQERFRKSMIPHYYRNVHAVIFVYDVTKISSFNNLSQWISELNQYQENPEEIPRILIGNKIDCISEIAVSTSMARKFADTHNMPLFETSATDDKEEDNINSIFMTLAHKLKNHKPMMLPRRNQSFEVNDTIVVGKSDKTNESSCCC